MLDKSEYLREMGIDVWVERKLHVLDPNLTNLPTESTESAENLNWNELSERVKSCTKCTLHKTRQQTVFGAGDRNTDLMIVGEAPGAEEDKLGEPFVGRAGQLLNSMLLALGFQRQQIFIANILKCRPPNNRDPEPDEAQACADYLNRQISLIAPKAILAVGRIAAQSLLDQQTPIGKMRGTSYQIRSTFDDKNIPVIVTYHPAYLLRSPQEKRKVWQDLRLLQRVMAEVP